MTTAARGATIGIVIIGRNEGERLARCLRSVIAPQRTVVYVDSGSTDESVSLAASLDVAVHSLDMNRSFTAARARNEGARLLLALEPACAFIQFFDGDCEMSVGWLDRGADFLRANPKAAVAFGRLEERHPEHSVYNYLCDMEWNTPVGESKSCGGCALFRREAFEQAGGYRDELIAGEEPELCVRLRASGWKVWRLDAHMGLHDAAITRFGQWWKRSMRGGYAAAEGARLHGASPERHYVTESRRAWSWGLGIPAVTGLASAYLGSPAAALLAVYPLQFIRLGMGGSGSPRQRWTRAFFLVLGKFPEAAGQLKFVTMLTFGRRGRLIEYK